MIIIIIISPPDQAAFYTDTFTACEVVQPDEPSMMIGRKQ